MADSGASDTAAALPLDNAAGLASALRAARTDGSARLAHLDRLLSTLRSQTVRDAVPDPPIFSELFSLLSAAWQEPFEAEAARTACELAAGLLALPEFAVGGVHVSDDFLDLAFSRLCQPANAAGAGAASLPAGPVSLVGSSGSSAAKSVRASSAPGGPGFGGSGGGSGFGGGDADAALKLELSTASEVVVWVYRWQPSSRAGLRLRIGRSPSSTLVIRRCEQGPLHGCSV